MWEIVIWYYFYGYVNVCFRWFIGNNKNMWERSF